MPWGEFIAAPSNGWPGGEAAGGEEVGADAGESGADGVAGLAVAVDGVAFALVGVVEQVDRFGVVGGQAVGVGRGAGPKAGERVGDRAELVGLHGHLGCPEDSGQRI